MSKGKKVIITIVVCLVLSGILFLGGFLLGRYQRVSGTTGSDAIQSTEAASEQIKQLESELESRINELNAIESTLGNARSSADECVRLAGQLRDDLNDIARESSDSLSYIRELRKRITDYESRINELSDSLDKLQKSLGE